MKRVVWVLWPAFLMAGMIEAVVFSAIDPLDLQFVANLQWSRNAVYSLAFLAIWAAVSVSSALTLLLATPDQPEAGSLLPPQEVKQAGQASHAST